jgi:DNA-binding transcriptional MerR regulator
MRIGELAGELGLNPRTIRYYEGIGLLPQPDRTGGNYRAYRREDVERLRFIKAAQRLGLTLDEIREVLAFAERGVPPCGFVRERLRREVAAIDARIAELQALRGELAGLEAKAGRLPARALKPGIIQLVDRILQVYVPTVLGAAALAAIVWTAGAWAVTGQVDWSKAVFAALAVLVMGYPCALGMSNPLAHDAGRRDRRRPGNLDALGRGVPGVRPDRPGGAGQDRHADRRPAHGGVPGIRSRVSESELLATASAAEASSEHPLARAIVQAAVAREPDSPDASDFASETGQGVTVTVGGARVAELPDDGSG